MYAYGLEQANHEIIGFCENDSWARKVLKKHWPTKPIGWCIKSLNIALEESLGGSPAKIFHSLALAKGYKGGVAPSKPLPDQDCSGRWLNPICWYDLDTGSWRTWQQSLIEGWELYLEPWPPAGVMRNGIAWERAPLAHPTIAPEYTFLLTPTATDGKGSSRSRYKGSENMRVGRMSAQFRISMDCPTFLNPSFAEVVMGLPKDFTLLETETLPVSSEN